MLSHQVSTKAGELHVELVAAVDVDLDQRASGVVGGDRVCRGAGDRVGVVGVEAFDGECGAAGAVAWPEDEVERLAVGDGAGDKHIGVGSIDSNATYTSACPSTGSGGPVAVCSIVASSSRLWERRASRSCRLIFVMIGDSRVAKLRNST